MAHDVFGTARVCAIAAMLCGSLVGGACDRADQLEQTSWSEISPPIAELLEADHLDEAVEDATLHVKQIQAKYGEEHPDVARAMCQLGLVHQYLNHFNEARTQYEHALKIREAVYGASHPSVAVSLLDIADVHRESGQYERAEPLYEQALITMEKARGKAHQDVSVVLHRFALLGHYRPNGARAEALIKRAIAIREKHQEQNPYAIVQSLVVLGGIYKGKDKYSEARTTYDKALKIMVNAKLDQDYTAGMLAYAIAILEKERGNNQEAEQFYRQAIKIEEDALGPEDPALGPVLQGYADVLRNLNRLEEAKQVEARANLLLKATLEKAQALQPTREDIKQLREHMNSLEKGE